MVKRYALDRLRSQARLAASIMYATQREGAQ